METMSVVLWRDEDGVVIAECPDVPGCVSQGRTRANAIRNLQSALRECLDVRREAGLPPTVETGAASK